MSAGLSAGTRWGAFGDGASERGAGGRWTSGVNRENRVGGMLPGRKPGRPGDGIGRPWRAVALLLLAAVLGFWWLQWQSAPAAPERTGQAATVADEGRPAAEDD